MQRSEVFDKFCEVNNPIGIKPMQLVMIKEALRLQGLSDFAFTISSEQKIITIVPRDGNKNVIYIKPKDISILGKIMKMASLPDWKLEFIKNVATSK